MPNLSVVGALAGGIGLFLLGMRLMTDGLKFAAGTSLRNILASSTSTPLRGILSGLFLTGLVQSSSAVTVATIGFVNAGLMDLAQSVAVVYGSNIGTTMTGWLVSLIGFKLHIKAFALPAIGAGMLLRVTQRQERQAAIGDVLVGFGLFFLGIDVLKSGFEGLENSIDFAAFAGTGIASLLLFVGVGFFLTLCMQSSSAAIALILTAVANGVLPFEDAAAVVIGANVGTTSTAALAVIGSTVLARRLASAHVFFNLVTGVVAFLLLPLIVSFLVYSEKLLGFGDDPVVRLALFHTVFNVLGVLILYPFTSRMVALLSLLWRSHDEDEARPRYLDNMVAATPILALHALEMELIRIGGIAQRMAKGALSAEVAPGKRLAGDKEIVEKLVMAVWDFTNRAQRQHLPAAMDSQLPIALRIAGYYNDVASLSIDLATGLADAKKLPTESNLAAEIAQFKKNTVHLVGDSLQCDETVCQVPDRNKLEELKEDYRAMKANFLRAASHGQITVGTLASYLDIISRIRRIAEQAEKAGRYLAGLTSKEIELAQSLDVIAFDSTNANPSSAEEKEVAGLEKT